MQHNITHALRFLGCASAMLLLSGCIMVKDFGKYWDKGNDDPCIQAIVRHHFVDHIESANNIHDIARTLDLGAHNFLMLRDTRAPSGGTLYRFQIKGGQFITYRLNESKREDFVKDFPGTDIIVTSETVTIPELNDTDAKLLEAVADREDYWVETDRLPYNPSRLEGCRGEPEPPHSDNPN